MKDFRVLNNDGTWDIEKTIESGVERPMSDPNEGVYICEECGRLIAAVMHLPTAYPEGNYPDRYVCQDCSVFEFKVHKLC